MHAHTYLYVCDDVLTKLYETFMLYNIINLKYDCYNARTGDYQHQGVHLRETQELLVASENRLEEASGAYVKCYMLVL